MSYKTPCLDSSVFIAGINSEIKKCIKRGALLDYLISKGRAGEIRLHMATAAIVEVYKSKSSGDMEGPSLESFMQLVDEELITPIELDRTTAIAAHRLCRCHVGLRPFDALHLACAISAGCDYLLTWDRRLANVVHDKITIKNPFISSPDLFSDFIHATPEEQHEWNCANPKRFDPCDMMFADGSGI